jgi:hypothetical protein
VQGRQKAALWWWLALLVQSHPITYLALGRNAPP